VRAAEGAVEPVERLPHRAEALDVGPPDARRPGPDRVERTLRADQPGYGRLVPRSYVRRCLQEHGRCGQVRVEELRDDADAVVR